MEPSSCPDSNRLLKAALILAVLVGAVACERSRRDELFQERAQLVKLKEDQEKTLVQVLQASPNPTDAQKTFINQLETELRSTTSRISVLDHELATTP